MMEVILANYESKDMSAVKQLFHLSAEGRELFPILQAQKQKMACTAYRGHQLAGFLMTWKNNFHPHALYFKILIVPSSRDSQIERLLMEKLKENHTGDQPLLTSIWETNDQQMNLYTAHGFTEIRRTYMPKLELSSAIARSDSKEERYSLHTLEEISSNLEQMDELAQLVKQNYESTHLVNPAAAMPLSVWKELILGKDTILDGSFLSYDEEGIAAYAFLHTSDERNTLEIGWSGVRKDVPSSCISQLVIRQIRYARERKYHFLAGEFDSTDKVAMEVFHSFPFQSVPAWVTLQKKE
jgi:ribosomal protein S18 acetylase RimI-like enzyme